MLHTLRLLRYVSASRSGIRSGACPSLLQSGIHSDIDRIYAAKEAMPENQHFVTINQKETLAQVFTDIRYKKADNEYKIIELARYKALGITADENKVGNAVSAATPFNNYARKTA